MIERLLAEEICNNWKNYLIIREENTAHLPEIERVIFNEPATIVFWKDKTKTIVLDDTETLFENEVKLSDVISSSLEDYNPKVGDKVEEIEKELNWSIDKKITDPITGEETVEKIIDENEVKEIIKDNNDNGIDTKLNTEWVEQSIEENI